MDNLIANLTGYVETKVELVKMEAKKEVTEGVSKTITYLVIAFVFGMVVLFLSLGTAIVLSDALGRFSGYAIVAIFYLIVGIILVLKRDDLCKKLEKQLSQPSKKKK